MLREDLRISWRNFCDCVTALLHALLRERWSDDDNDRIQPILPSPLSSSSTSTRQNHGFVFSRGASDFMKRSSGELEEDR